ncbi:MAG: hypothetical protein AMK71_00330 [Nitrospira bacterium SG8_35_4]|nr:MAG: hypothetical protein AMK71_00330 [Nitrospira bacterium SG8_35_4]
MREYAFWAVILLAIPFIMKKPLWGIVLYTAVNIIRPEMLFWEGSQGGEVFMVVIAVTMLSTIINMSAKQKLSVASIVGLPVLFAGEVMRNQHLRLILWLYVGLIVSIELASYTPSRAYYYSYEILKLLIFCLLITLNIKNGENIKAYENYLMLPIVLLGAWGIEQYFRGNYRLEGLGGHAFPDSNGVAAIFVLFAPVAYNMLMNSENKRGRLAGFAASFVVVVLIVCTLSRGGLLGLLVASMVFTLYSRYKIKLIVMATILILLITPFLTEVYIDRINTMKDIETIDYSAKSRLVLWQAGLMIFRDNPFFGSGFMTYPAVKFQYMDAFDFLDPGLRDHVFKIEGSRVTHNTYIQLLAEGGLFLAIPFFWLIIETFIKNRGIRRKYGKGGKYNDLINLMIAIEAGIAGYCVCILFINAITGIFLFIQISICALIRHVIVKESKEGPPELKGANGVEVPV